MGPVETTPSRRMSARSSISLLSSTGTGTTLSNNSVTSITTASTPSPTYSKMSPTYRKSPPPPNTNNYSAPPPVPSLVRRGSQIQTVTTTNANAGTHHPVALAASPYSQLEGHFEEVRKLLAGHCITHDQSFSALDYGCSGPLDGSIATTPDCACYRE